jgi:hypothetical protein
MGGRHGVLPESTGRLAGRLEPRVGRVYRVGYLLLPPLAEKPSAERQAFLDGLRERGYDEGRNVIIDYRSAAWNPELLPVLAEELVARKVDVILSAAPQATLAAREATKTIPIVMIAAIDAVESGFVASFSRSGTTSPDSAAACRALPANGSSYFVRRREDVRLAAHQDRYPGVDQDLRRLAAEQECGHPSTPMRGHENQIAPLVSAASIMA